MGQLTRKSLFQYVVQEIDNRTKFSSTSIYKDQLSRDSVSPVVDMGRYDISTAELVRAIQDNLAEALPSKIIEGLIVEATDPISAQVSLSVGKGTAGGELYEITSPITITIPFDDTASVFYITLYKDNVVIEKAFSSTKLTVAKIIVPQPGVTSLVQDTKDTSWNAYIVNFTEYKLYGYNDKFEEDTIELLRDNISPILANNLIGNIRLNEDLKIINTAGTLELNSDSLKLYDEDENLLSKFNRKGVYFYNTSGIEMARFTNIDARIGNILITKNSLESSNFVTGTSGFQIKDDGNVEFSNGTFRGTLQATVGDIGGWTIDATSIYATTTGTIKTSATVGVGSDGVILDKDGLRVYDSVLGEVVNFPSDGSTPTISSGTITETSFEISTNGVMRTSATVGDGTASSAGILINNVGLYVCEANQVLSNANVKILATGNAYFKGEIQANSGSIGNVTINATGLYGGLIEGSLIRAPIIESSSTYPKVRLDEEGLYYTISGGTGLYGEFKYDEGIYGAGTIAYLFNTNFPIFSIEAEGIYADIHLFNREDDPGSETGPHRLGDLICVDGDLKICTEVGSPGTFSALATLVDVNDKAPKDATYIVQTSNGTLTNEQILASLSTGIMYVSTTTGVITSLGNPLPIANGGTNSTTQNFVDLTTEQTVAGTKTVNSLKLGGAMDCNLQAVNKLVIGQTAMTTAGGIWYVP